MGNHHSKHEYRNNDDFNEQILNTPGATFPVLPTAQPVNLIQKRVRGTPEGTGQTS